MHLELLSPSILIKLAPHDLLDLTENEQIAVDLGVSGYDLKLGSGESLRNAELGNMMTLSALS